MPRTNDITRRRDLSEKCVIALCISLLVCMGFHHASATKAVAVAVASILTGPAGCAQPPAFTVGITAHVASDDDLMPKTGSTRARASTTTTTTTPPAPTARPTPATPPAP